MKKLFFKRMLSLVLALVLLIGLLPYSIPTANAATGPSTTVTIDGLTYTFTVTQHTSLGTDLLGYDKINRIKMNGS